MSDTTNVSTELDSVIDHLNAEHADSVLLIARHVGDRPGLIEARLVASTADHLEIAGTSDPTTHVGDESIAIPYRGVPVTLDDLRTELFDMLAAARERAGESVPLTSIERELAGSSDLSTFVTRVVACKRLTPHLAEVTVRGGLDTFGSLGGDQYVYVLLPPPGRTDLTVGTDFTWAACDDMDEAERPVGAYYTVRRWRPAAGEIDLWFVLHHAGDATGDGAVDAGVDAGVDASNGGGHASRWAAGAEPGDHLALWGPKAAFDPPDDSCAFLLVGDETGLAAIAAVIEQVVATNREVTIDVIAEVADVEHTVAFIDHPAVTTTWLFRDGTPPGAGQALLDAVRQRLPPMPIDVGTMYAFGAGESKQITAVRRYLRDECGLAHGQVSMTGYWRRTRPDLT